MQQGLVDKAFFSLARPLEDSYAYHPRYPLKLEDEGSAAPPGIQGIFQDQTQNKKLNA
jgi:hypothetical protein